MHKLMHGVTVGFALIGSSSGHFRGCLCLGLPRLRTQLGQIHLWDSRHPQGKEIDSLSIGGIVISFRFLRTYLSGLGGENIPLSRERGFNPVRQLLRRQRRPLRTADGAGGRRLLGRPQPRLHHRRSSTLQSQETQIRSQGYERFGKMRRLKGNETVKQFSKIDSCSARPGKAALGQPRCPLQTDCDRRSVFHGRERCSAA